MSYVILMFRIRIGNDEVLLPASHHIMLSINWNYFTYDLPGDSLLLIMCIRIQQRHIIIDTFTLINMINEGEWLRVVCSVMILVDDNKSWKMATSWSLSLPFLIIMISESVELGDWNYVFMEIKKLLYS